MVTQKKKLNLIPNEDIIVIPVSQYDTGEDRLVLDLILNGESYSPTGTGVIQGTKANGDTFTHSVTITGSQAVSDLHSDMTDIAGQTKAQIVITEGDSRTGSQVFFLSVQKDAEGEL